MPASTAPIFTLAGPSSVPPPKTPVASPVPPNIAHSMTPSTHPPSSLFAIGSGNPTSAAALLLANSQPQPSPFLQPLSVASPAAQPPPSSSSSSLLQALGRTPSQSQPSQGVAQTLQRPQFLPAQEAQRVLGLGEHPDPSAIARASLVQMNEMSRRAESGSSFCPSVTSRSPSSSGPDVTTNSGQDTLSRISQMHLQMHDPGTSAGDEPFILPPDMWEPPAQHAHEGLQVFTLGHLLPRSNVEDSNGNWTYPGDDGAAGSGSGSTAQAGDAVGGENEGYKEDSPGPEEVVQPTPMNPSSASPSPASSPSSSSSPSGAGTHKKLRVRRSTFVPGWAVPPRVLLVDDDAVSRRLSSKFLQVFGCAIDVAVDGVGAVTKMNLEKYDLVLMVCVDAYSLLIIGTDPSFRTL